MMLNNFRISMVLLLIFYSMASSPVQAQDTNYPDDRVNVDPITVTVFERGRVVAKATIEVVLKVRDEDKAADIRNRIPQLRSDFITALSQLSQARFRVDEPIDPTLVKEYLTLFADRRLGPGMVDIYIVQANVELL